MYEVMAMARAVWSRLYAWKGPALVILGKETNGNKWKQMARERNRNGKERVCDITPPLKNHVLVI